ncbi:nicotinate-nucleotide--dimethylbenzimidazole phosphoribosyltransferase [Vibrio sonorensis]|uniref:nicotinate-nucleotide--dimethylbenzimidazole phosphoribosyltransferase n=1 Tax=Vibrio sonorensis TaxID=1004316 RepID=UPI0008DB094E|nr:nicotinate-nucleotide--dimethylbenzimidazole phosphoribosyltransferase [Vibrio sonorensis]
MLDRQYSERIWHRINQKTKPLGALGQLEQLAHDLALIQSNKKGDAVTSIELNKPTILVFAADHGIAQHGVSIAPSEVTQQMVLNFLAGGAAVNCFCRVNQVEFYVVDSGILLPVASDSAQLVSQPLGNGTKDFSTVAAMSMEQVEKGIELGQKLIRQKVKEGSDLLMFGEMGIANTSSAAALLAALSELPVEICVGRGTGITDQQFAKKRSLVECGVSRCSGLTPKQILAEVGGFEIVQMVGGFLAAAEEGVPVLVDGFIATAAAYVACQIAPECREYMIFAHQSEEAGHKHMLTRLEAKPLLDLSMRLGEGTGAVLAVSLVRAAVEFYNHMASFEQAGVTV